MSMIAPDNRIVHGMWFGTKLSRMELLTLHSFANFGHEFHLWAYDDLTAYDLPKGVVLRDATKIIPRGKVFAKAKADRMTGVGKNSYGAPFSDLFRYKLLYEQGGIWADMDITCLKPFAFEGDYAFRPHRIGVVGSVLKCPKRSKLMQKAFDETVRSVNEDTEDYLLPNRILTRHVAEAGLERFVVPEMSNGDNWSEFVRPMIERLASIPDQWFAIHWINEMFRTLGADKGRYRGKALLDYVPDKNAPLPGSTLWELYRKYGLIDPWEEGPRGRAQRGAQLKKTAASLPVISYKDRPATASHLNELLPSLLRGGAERAVLETMAAQKGGEGLTQKLFVVHRSRRQYPVTASSNLKLAFGEHGGAVADSLRDFALEILRSPVPVVYTHLIPVRDLAHLWSMGVGTIPVIQNGEPAWNDDAKAFDNPRIPFVVTVSDKTADEMRAAGCPKPVIAIRHELQRFFTPEELQRNRREIRERYGLSDTTLLIGMVGQFKSQKAYTRAVRVLERLREHAPARLMILGGWDHEYGGGRAAYEAACRRAVDLGVIADMIMPGDIHPIDPYLAAFDVFLNTSIHEGLSVALLEAIQAGCPIVTADAGGNAEVLPENGVLVKDGADIDAYVAGILKVVAPSERLVPLPPPEPKLVPSLWTLIAKHGVVSSLPRPGAATGTLFVTQNLAIGGPQQSLVNLLSALPKGRNRAVLMLDGVPQEGYKARLDDARTQIYSAAGAPGNVDKAETVLRWADALHVRTICFWNVAPEVKLLVAKVLASRDIGLIDVSPGPMLFDELDAAEPFARRVTLTKEQYFARLDGFVAKHAKGVPPESWCPDRDKVRVIRNGVYPPPNFVPLPPPQYLLPRQFDPALAIGACCRIVPDKRIEFLLDAMKHLGAREPGASLTIVGGPDSRSGDYLADLQMRLIEDGLSNVFMVGEHDDVLPFLARFSVFAMVSERESCPNASLEAMAMGLPVVARRSDAAEEQVEDGRNGYLVSSPEEMAERLAGLLKNRRLRAKFAKAARTTALKRFSMEKMAREYSRLLDEGEA